MTENEAINELQSNIDLPFGFTVSDEVSEIAIKALEEIKQYRTIGTIKELQELKEKNVAKKSEWEYYRKENMVICKNCSYEHYLGTYHQYATNYCPNCGSDMTET